MRTPSRRYWWLPPSQRAERDEQIREKWALGWTKKELAEEYNLTPQRIWQICNYYLERNREKYREANRQLQQNNRERYVARNAVRARTTRHGISQEQRDQMYDAQGRSCAGCGESYDNEALEIDHDHDHCEVCAGKWSCGESIRGLLCRSCNYHDVLRGG